VLEILEFVGDWLDTAEPQGGTAVVLAGFEGAAVLTQGQGIGE
jgi:hypothetical protein